MPSANIEDPSNGATEDDGTSNGPTSSPLLFFVALGFGVVFTNLWYVVRCRVVWPVIPRADCV